MAWEPKILKVMSISMCPLKIMGKNQVHVTRQIKTVRIRHLNQVKRNSSVENFGRDIGEFFWWEWNISYT